MSVYACSDLHGMLELYQQIKNFIQPEDKVYFLGDAGDRGLQCWETLKAILSDPQFECIIGNHEDMLYDCMNDFFKFGDCDCLREESFDILRWNGGSDTFFGWLEETPGKRFDWFHRIKFLPDHLEYVNKDNKKIVMTHAGFTPNPEKPDWYGGKDDLIWQRDHFTHAWPHDADENLIILHGHTPIKYLINDLQRKDKSIKMPKLPTAYWYCDNHKCDIDNGAFYTKCTVLLNLDTFEEHKFYTKDYTSNIE